MSTTSKKIVSESLTYDDVLLVPDYSEIIPQEVNINSMFSRNISLNIPIVSAAMDTVTESRMAISIAQEGGIGVIHKNMSIKKQAEKIRRVKRAESGMIIDPITLPLTSTVEDAKKSMKENRIGGIPIINSDGFLIGIVTNRDLRFEKRNDRKITEVMTKENLITVGEGTSLQEAEIILQENKIEKPRNVEIINIIPRIRICKVKLISDEKIKFGKKTLKNKNTLGFKTFIKKPVL